MQTSGMDIRSAQYLVAVVDQGSVTAAADSLRISQPYLSQAVRNLQRTLGTTLFERTTRGLTPTPAGLAVAESARRLLADVTNAENAVAAVIDLRSGELAIAVQSDLGIEAVAEAAGRLHLFAPAITVTTTAAPSARDVRALVRAGTCELGFAERPAGDTSPDGLREVDMGAQETVLSIPPHLACEIPDPVPHALVGSLPMIVDISTNRWITPVGAEMELSHVVVEVSDRLTVREMVSQGVGLAFLPRSIAEQDAPDAVVRSLHPPVFRQTDLVLREGPLSPAAQAYIENLSVAHRHATNSFPKGDSLSGSNSMP